MREVKLGKTGLSFPPIIAGCMRMPEKSIDEATRFIEKAVEAGIKYFDHADIYGDGEAETVFAAALEKSSVSRDSLFIQSKCGIIPGVCYDLSKDYILQSVDGILERLKIDTLDMLLLHRPDALVEPEEVAEAFNILQSSGKVRYFGVSNHNPEQIELLKKYVEQEIVVNQLQLSLPSAHMITTGMHVNMMDEGAIMRDGSVLDYSRLNDITIQTWSPLQYGFFEGVFLGSDRYKELNSVAEEIGEKYGVSSTAIAIAWILRHPAGMMAVTGTMNPDRFKECVNALTIHLTREEWYKLYLAAGNTLP